MKISDYGQEDNEKKKFIMNKNLGLIEKKYNKKSITKIYHTMKEAQYYQIKYGGYIHRVSETTYEDEELTQEERDEGIIERVSAKKKESYMFL